MWMVPNIAYMWCTKRLINGLDRIGLRVQISLLSSPSRVEVGRQGASPTGGRGSRKDTQPLDVYGDDLKKNDVMEHYIMENFHQIMLEKEEMEMMENSNIKMYAKLTHSMGPKRLNKIFSIINNCINLIAILLE